MASEPFHTALKSLREQRGLSQSKLARLAYINAGYLSRVEHGQRMPSVKIAKALDDALQAEGALLAIVAEQRSGRRARATRQTGAVVALHGTLDPWASAQMPPDSLGSAIESPAWFGMRLAHVIATVDNWQGIPDQTDALQELLHREITMFDSSAAGDPPMVHSISRRQALVTLAALPVAFATSGPGTHGATAATEFFLSRSAASITACWHLLRGSDLSTVDQLLGTYALPLEAIAQRPSRYQRAAAKLASQAHRVLGILALHRNQLGMREHHCKQALLYANVAEHPGSCVSALISLASTYFYRSDPVQAATLYEQARSYDSDVSALQRSRIHAELGVVYGQLQREPDALAAFERAEELYPADPEQDPSYLYAEFTRASLALEQGLTYLSLAEHYPSRDYKATAAKIFARVESAPLSSVPDRIRYEVNNHQARTAVLLNDLDAFEVYVERGLQGAALLRSVQRTRELHTACQRALERWPQERRLRGLDDRLQLPSGIAQMDS